MNHTREPLASSSAATSTSAQTSTGGKKALLITLAICLTPIVIGSGLFLAGWRPAKGTNHGSLVQPPRPLPIVALGVDAGTRAEGKWLLVLAGNAPCETACVAQAEFTRNIQVALNRDMGRLVRIVLANPNENLTTLKSRQPDLLVVTPPSVWLDLMKPGPRHRLFIVDPSGNMMMEYTPEADAKGVRADLERLLRFSWIG